MSEFVVSYRQVDSSAVEAKPIATMILDLIAVASAKSPAAEIRSRMEALERELEKLPQVEQPLEHFFADGLYGRRIFNPRDSLIITKIHKQANFSYLLSGRFSVITENGLEIIEGPRFWVTKPGTKRVIYAQTDVVFMTVHPNHDNCTDLDVLESRIIAREFSELGCEVAR